MVRATYSDNLLEWGETSFNDKRKSPSFMQIMLGTCGGMVDAANVIFNTDQSCSINSGGVESERLNLARGKMSHSLRRSKEVTEIPEFLDADFRAGNQRFSLTGDDISLLSSYTLEQMAQPKHFEQDSLFRGRKVLEDSAWSAVLTEVSEDCQDDARGDSWHSYYTKVAPLSGMVVKSRTTKSDGSICSGESVSTLGIDTMT
jgi:hypothetical protein